jgi:hypothetical protein
MPLPTARISGKADGPSQKKGLRDFAAYDVGQQGRKRALKGIVDEACQL